VDPNIGCPRKGPTKQEPTRLYTFPREGKINRRTPGTGRRGKAFAMPRLKPVEEDREMEKSIDATDYTPRSTCRKQNFPCVPDCLSGRRRCSGAGTPWTFTEK
jgi:hypothetical protein